MKFLSQLFPKDQKRILAKEVRELPSPLRLRTVYIVLEGKQKLHAAFICPCGCTATILLNLIRDTDPYWKIRTGKVQGVSISPSIWRTSGCRSHFFIRRGKIIWAREY